MKYCIIALIFFKSIITLAQDPGVGVGTHNPQTTLDVNGDLNVSQSIHIGGASISAGDSGQFIISAGKEGSAHWGTKEIPAGYGDSYSLSQMDSFTDNTGVQFDGNSTGNTEPYDNNAPLSTAVGWKEIPGLENTITLVQPTNKVNLHLQTMTQISGGTLASFACGFFLNDDFSDRSIFRLKGVRTDVMIAPSGSYRLFNMNTTFENVLPGQYDVKVGCIKRNIANNITLGIGKAINASTLSQSMAQSTLNVYTLEKS